MNIYPPPISIDVVVRGADPLGETPLWRNRTSNLWWLDIDQSKPQSFDPATGAQSLDNRLNDGPVDAGGRFWVGPMNNALHRTPEQQQRMQVAADKALAWSDAEYLKQQDELIEFFKQVGLDVYEPDVDAFRIYASKKYLESALSANWPEGMLDKINAL